MPKEEWGVKRLCPKCATRFYDLQNDPMTCPSCGFEFDVASLADGGKAAVAKAKAKEEEAAEDPIIADVEDALNDEPSADDDLLDDDDDETIALDEVADVAVNDDDN